MYKPPLPLLPNIGPSNLSFVRIFVWSKETYQLDQVIEEPRNSGLYYLQNGSDKVFICELVHIAEDTQVPSK